MDKDIASFINLQKIASMCCIDENDRPQCFNCVYSFMEEECILIFKSSPQSLHIRNMLERPFVSGTILPAKQQPLASTGIQFCGEMHPASIKYRKGYYIKNPAAVAVPGELYCIKLTLVKMTERSPLRSRKLIWESTPNQAHH